MPTFHLETNVKRADIKDLDGFMAKISKTLSEVLKNKPEVYIQVVVVPDTPILMSGKPGPSVCAFLSSIGSLGVEENQAIAGAVYPLIEDHLGVPGDKCYLNFYDKTPADVALSGKTFHGIL